MDPSNGSCTHVENGVVERGDWRVQLQADSRQRIVNKIIDTLEKHVPYCGDEGLQEIKRIADKFEDKIYTTATSQSDYLRKISLKMLIMETKSQDPMSRPELSNTAANSVNPQIQIGAVGDPVVELGDWRTQLQANSRQRIVNKIIDTLQRHLPYCGDEGLQEIKKIADKFEQKIYTTATSQSDYLRKIALKMLTMETRSQKPMLSNSDAGARL